MLCKIEVEDKGFIGRNPFPGSGYCFVPNAYQAAIFKDFMTVIHEVFPSVDIPDDSCTIWRSYRGDLYFNYDNEILADNK